MTNSFRETVEIKEENYGLIPDSGSMKRNSLKLKIEKITREALWTFRIRVNIVLIRYLLMKLKNVMGQIVTK